MEQKIYSSLGEIRFGMLDAYSEYLEYGKEAYKSLFFACPNFHVERFLNGQSYYIHGDKGSGKTALVKYVELLAEEQGGFCEFIRFKKDIDEEERNSIKRAGLPPNPFEEVIEREIPDDVSINCVYAWQVYIIKCIVNRLDAEKGVFLRDKTWDALVKLVKAAYKSDTSVIKSIIPKLRRGNLKIELPNIVELGVDFDWEDNTAKTVSFNAFAKKILQLYSGLKADKGTCYILFDELELVYLKKKAYTRDIALIRDLIQAVFYTNEVSKQQHFSIRIIACIRNEVYRNAAAVGLELNKMIHDYGIELSWNQKGGSVEENPLILMLKNRMLQSQDKRTIATSVDIWKVYFDDKIYINPNGEDTMNYIIDQTWNKPRDLARLFKLIQDNFESSFKIRQAHFEAVRQVYSEESWGEFSNELSAQYTQNEIEAIKQVLINITIPFTTADFAQRISEKAEYFTTVKQLESNRRPADILNDLYRIGVIGNDGKRVRFSFKGYEDFDPTAACTIHYPLRRYFSATVKRRD